MSSVALPKLSNYGIKPTSVKANRRELSLLSANKTSFSPSDTAQFYLPALANNVMDGQSMFLRFTATITGAGFIDNSAQSFIDRIQIYGSGGAVIADIQNYAELAAIMLDLQMSQSEKIGLSALWGTEDSYLTPTAGAAAFATVGTPTANEVSALIPNANRKGQAVADGVSYAFAIPLLTPLSTLSEKYFPMFALSDDIRIDITWSSAVNALVSSTNFVINNPEICVQYIEFDSAVIDLIKQTYKGRELVIPAESYRTYTSVIPSGTIGNFSAIVPCKLASARAMFFSFRPAQTQVAGSYAVSSRVNPFYTANDSFNLNIGGNKYPQNSIRTKVAGNASDYFAHTQTALHAFNNLDMNGCLNRTYYNSSASQTGHASGVNAFTNGFVLGVGLDSITGNSDTMNSGLNLSQITTYYEATIGASSKNTTGGDENLSVSTFCLHDVLFVVDSNGIMSSIQ
jgi:hypothetical protein